MNQKQKTITSTKFQRVFWLNENQDFCSSSIDSFKENKKQFLEFEIFEYVSEWLTVHKSTTNTPQELEEVLDIFKHLVIVQMGGFSTMLDSYRNKQTQPLPKQ